MWKLHWRPKLVKNNKAHKREEWPPTRKHQAHNRTPQQVQGDCRHRRKEHPWDVSIPKYLEKCPSLMVPNEFLCPISPEIITDLVIIASVRVCFVLCHSSACSGGRIVSWIIYCWLVLCERKTLFPAGNLRSFTGKRTGTMEVTIKDLIAGNHCSCNHQRFDCW